MLPSDDMPPTTCSMLVATDTVADAIGYDVPADKSANVLSTCQRAEKNKLHDINNAYKLLTGDLFTPLAASILFKVNQCVFMVGYYELKSTLKSC
jgi:hypothetical protein